MSDTEDSRCAPNERPLNDLLQDNFLKLQINDSAVCSNLHSIADLEVLEGSSGGLALQGVFKTSNAEDLLKNRQQLIQVKTCKLSCPSHKSEYKKDEFSSYKSYKTFSRLTEKLGFSFTTKLGSTDAEIGFGFTSETFNNTSVRDHSEHAYILQTTCHYIPLACTYLGEVYLSDSALTELKDINKLLNCFDGQGSHRDLMTRAKNFFETFGSHAAKGPIHFGGTFWWNACAEGFSSQKHNQIKSLVSKTLDLNMRVALEENMTLGLKKQQAVSCGASSDELRSCVQLSIEKSGGPPEVNDYSLWKNALVSSNKTWAVIDRGQDLTPVWEIISSTHAEDFKDHFNLCDFLKNAYENITHLNPDHKAGEKVLRAVREAEKMMESVPDWSVTHAEHYLDELLKIKNQMREETSSYRMWCDICLANKNLQGFLKDITVKHHEDNLKVMTQSIMDSSHLVKDFPYKHDILKWMQEENAGSGETTEEEAPVNHITDLKRVLKNERDNLQRLQSVDVRKSATCRVTTAFKSFCKALEKDGQNELILLLQTVIKTVGYQGDTFCPIVDLKEAEFLLATLPAVYETYTNLRNISQLKGNAYALLTMLQVSYKRRNFDEQEILDSYLNLKAELSPDIKVAINECLPNKNWILLQDKLASLTQETTEEVKCTPPESCILGERLSTQQMPLEMAECGQKHCGSLEITSEHLETIKNLFLRMGLLDFYPDKITMSDILSITTLSLNDSDLRTDSKLWVYFINKLMTLDVNCRYVCCKAPETECTMTILNIDDLLNFETENSENNNEETHVQTSSVHPMDVYMAVFHCTDDLAREHIINKLSKCQFALPLLVPNPFTGQIEVAASVLQSIKKTWVSRNQMGTDSSVEHKSHFLFRTPIPVVSFIRLGKSQISKSQIINYLLNQNKHPTFFNRQCSGSTETHLLLDGVAEIFWYCPSGKHNDIFPNSVAFINLHGDANKHPRQLQLIQEMSSVTVVLLPENLQQVELKDSIKKLQKELIYLFSGVEHIPSSNDNRIAAKNRNEPDLRKEIISKVTQALNKKNDLKTLESHISKAQERGIIVTKEHQELRSGQEGANNLIKILKNGTEENLLKLKNELLPLQADLWRDWSKYDKEFHRLQSTREMSISQKLTEIKNKKNQVRKTQLEGSQNLNEFMRTFLNYGLHTENQIEGIAMFNWLKKYLDEIYMDILTTLQDQYHKSWTHNRKNKSEVKGSEYKNLLHSISEDMKSASFGVHHIMRELAQIYEAMHSCHESSICGFEKERLPEFGAEILLSGSPIELLDGDVNHVPLSWISAVLDKLIQKIGDKKVLVISVLGLQSSGKSTLLNAMFGLQFAVSSGCCTKGAFMQLVPVEQELRHQLQFDFVLLLDTEGLRSVEADTALSHDNELATFVVGVADITIVNIMGENPCEMQDILQICFQAFLRMVSVEIKPCCFFVHQNVAETAAKDKNQGGRRQLILKLDEISKMIAEAEDREVSGFNDIIQFDAETQVFYFRNYFDGNPPMAPPNPAYSQDAQELKSKLLSIAKWQPHCKLPLLSEFKARIENLWNALLNENFVFHFRNSLHVMVYTKLEENYVKWAWTMRKHALETQNTIHYKTSSCESYETQIGQFKHDFEEIYKDLKKGVDSYFREERYPEILVQWKDNTEKRLEHLKKELVEETSAKEQELLKRKKYRLALDQKKCEYEADLLQKSKDLASQLKAEKPNEEELQTRFDTMWITWETEVASEKPPEEFINIQAMVEKTLQDYFAKYWDRIDLNRELENFNANAHVKHSWRETLGLNLLKKTLTEQQQQAGNALCQKVQDAIDKILAKREKENFGVNDNFIHQMLIEVMCMIEQYEKSISITFTGAYRAQVVVNEFNKVVKKLKTLNENFSRKNDPLVYLNSKKEEYFKLFKCFCDGATSVTFFVYYLVNYLAPVVLNAVKDKLSIQIVEDLKNNHPAFKGTRSYLENQILKDLAEKEDFEMYMKYILEPQQVFRDFITEQTENYITKSANIAEIVSATWSSFNDEIISASNCVTRIMMEKQGKSKASVWLDEFCGQLGKHMAISRMDLKSIENEDIQNPDFLKSHFSKSLKEVIDTECKKHTQMLEKGPILFTLTNRPDDILCKQLGGCWEQCPFCKAVCTNTIPGHDTDHTVQMHRPQALGNLLTLEYEWRLWNQSENTDKANSYLFGLIQTKKQFYLNFCTSSDNSKFFSPVSKKWIKFKDYKQAGSPYDRWYFRNDGIEGLYWKWFICTFWTKLEEFYGWDFRGQRTIPKEWENITKEDALRDLHLTH